VFTLGHSSGVAHLAAAAGEAVGLEAEARKSLRCAGLLHDLGRGSVPTGVWEKPGALTGAEWGRGRLHPYYTEPVPARSPLLRPLSLLAGGHHERLDGSGYFRNAPAQVLALPARVLAAADVYHALGEDRPHRPALPPREAARALEAEAAQGRLDRQAV